jgi:hypothetical protein
VDDLREEAMQRWLVALFLVLLVTAPSLAFVSRVGDVVTVSEAVRDDLYVAGRTVTVRGPVDGDVAAAGGTVVLEGPNFGGVLAAGGTVRIRGRSAVACARPVERLGWKRRWGRTRSWQVGS